MTIKIIQNVCKLFFYLSNHLLISIKNSKQKRDAPAHLPKDFPFKEMIKEPAKMGLKTTNLTESNLFKELEALVVHNKLMTPQAKGMAGIILYKLQNEMPINEKEEKFYNELLLFMNVPAN